MAFDQDAVDRAVEILQPQIDKLKVRPTFRRIVRYVIQYDTGPDDVFVVVETPEA